MVCVRVDILDHFSIYLSFCKTSQVDRIYNICDLGMMAIWAVTSLKHVDSFVPRSGRDQVPKRLECNQLRLHTFQKAYNLTFQKIVVKRML